MNQGGDADAGEEGLEEAVAGVHVEYVFGAERSAEEICTRPWPWCTTDAVGLAGQDVRERAHLAKELGVGDAAPLACPRSGYHAISPVANPLLLAVSKRRSPDRALASQLTTHRNPYPPSPRAPRSTQPGLGPHAAPSARLSRRPPDRHGATGCVTTGSGESFIGIGFRVSIGEDQERSRRIGTQRQVSGQARARDPVSRVLVPHNRLRDSVATGGLFVVACAGECSRGEDPDRYPR
ncbi:hypothetical protein B0H13DRAFT_1853779 [Mycena leptocephala]|nr:hypothetical protein B0H13DRAFT_1853779 [Mycena leptocephala]